jgi:hypothetical protein
MASRLGLRWNCWPEQSDHLLLTAAAHADEAVAFAAWTEARGCVLSPTQEQRRLFGQLAGRVAILDPTDSLLPELQGVSRTIRAENLQHLMNIDEVMGMLETAGIDAVVLKGTALLLSVYDNLSLRPIADVDVWVHPDRHEDALAVFASAGFAPDQRDHVGNHAIGMVGGPISVDVHRAINQELVAPALANNGWGTFACIASPKALPSGRHITILDSADALLHTIVHGLGWNGPVALRWVTDSVHLLRSGTVDLDRVYMLSDRLAIAPVVHDALRYVDEVAGGLVDATVFIRLAAIQTSRLGQLRLRAFHERPEREGEPPALGFTTSRFLQRTKADRPLQAIGRFPRVLRDQFKSDGWFELFRKMMGAALVRVGKRVAGTSPDV